MYNVHNFFYKQMLKQKLLIVDDDETTRLLITEILKGTKVNILETRSGVEAHNLYKKYSCEIDLVLLDIKLPDCNGWELLKQFRQINPLVPCVAASAISRVELRRRCDLGEIDAYISKPFYIEEFKRLISVFLK
jgi:CheY-like chemotaxis protein